MKKTRIKKLLRQPAIGSVLTKLSGSDNPLTVTDREGALLYGATRDGATKRSSVYLKGEPVGWVYGHRNTRFAADLVGCFLGQEAEKTELVNETLERYKEIMLLYSLGDRLSTSLDLNKVADLVLNEALHQLPGESAALYVYSDKNKSFECVARQGPRYAGLEPAEIRPCPMEFNIFASEQAEIVNQVKHDPRYKTATPADAVGSGKIPESLICSPLRVQEKSIGLACLSSETEINYTSGDLKLFNAIASQAANSLENSILHENELREQKIKSNLQRYISSSLVEAIIDEENSVNLEPQRKHLTVLFTDIRNFTRSCENLPPEKIVGYLNTYFSDLVDIIFRHNGTINKFVGDMIVALFGAPAELENSELAAVRAGMEMQKLLSEHPDPWIRENFRTGIGIGHGEVVVGNIGSREHMDYTAIGDAVNIAARLQGMAAGGQILVTQSVYQKVNEIVKCGIFGSEVSLKGREQKIPVYEVISEK